MTAYYRKPKQFLDTVSGVMCACSKRTPDVFTSFRLRACFSKLTTYGLVLLFGIGLDSLTGIPFPLITGMLTSIVVLTEAKSIEENTTTLGMRYPPGFHNALESVCQWKFCGLGKPEEKPKSKDE